MRKTDFHIKCFVLGLVLKQRQREFGNGLFRFPVCLRAQDRGTGSPYLKQSMFKTIHKLAPKYLHQLFTPRRSEYNLRNLEGKLALPKPHTNYLKRSFSYSGALLWNNLPQEMRDTDSTGLFKRKISNRISDISDSHTAIMQNSVKAFF